MRNGKDDFLTWDHLNEIADLPDHFCFAMDLFEKYQWEAGVKKELEALIERIRAKQQDDKLNLSVIGEFTSGKSTLINAILRADLLESSALQGTTVATTILEYARDYGIKLRYQEGHEEAYRYNSFEELKEQLARYTTEPETAKRLYSVSVYMPSKTLESGIRVIDTPGTNAIEAWHEEVTIRTIEELSDISIIVTDAMKIMPQTLCRFVGEYLEPVLPQCVFIVTKIELVPDREREKLLAYVQKKVEHDFGLKNVLVLPYASAAVMNSVKPDLFTSYANRDADLKMTFMNEARLMHHMARQRTIAQTKKIVILINRMYEVLSGEMSHLSQTYEAERDMLLRTRQTDLKAFVAEQKQVHTAAFDRRAKEERTDIVNSFYIFSGQARENILQKVDGPGTLDELKRYVDTALGNDCAEEARLMISRGRREYIDVVDWFEEEMLEYWNSFEQLFKSLNLLTVDVSKKNSSLPEAVEIPMADLVESGKYVAEELSKENTAYLGGGAAGAAIGTVLAPGIGTVLGGIIGFVGGAFFAPDITAVKSSTKEKLAVSLDSYFEQAVYQLTVALDTYISRMRNHLSAEIDKYLVAYNHDVAKKIEEEERKQAAVEAKISALKKDMESISQREFRLNSVNEQLNLLSGKGENA